jgi:NTP pyrophosphatase (non-canonical NTP hydrolase)
MEQGIRNTTKEDKEDAIGDIIIYLADYCNRNGINLEKSLEQAWRTASLRDWIKFPKNGRTE